MKSMPAVMNQRLVRMLIALIFAGLLGVLVLNWSRNDDVVRTNRVLADHVASDAMFLISPAVGDDYSDTVSEVNELIDDIEKVWFVGGGEGAIASGESQYIRMPLDSRWVRDFLPWEGRLDGNNQPILLKTQYLPISPLRPYDDRSAINLADHFRVPLVPVPLVMDGGSVVINGSGIALVSKRVVEQNQFWGYTQVEIEAVLERYFGFTDCIFVSPLVGEPTGHLDLLASFLNESTLLIARVAPEQDRANAELLDRAADEIQRKWGDRFGIRVVRIDMPSAIDGVWRTFANLVHVGNTILVPIYKKLKPEESAAAIAKLESLMPSRRIKGVDCSDLVQRGGALHCISRGYTQQLVSRRSPAWSGSTDAPRTVPELVEAWGADRLTTLWELSTSDQANQDLLLDVLLENPLYPESLRRDCAFLLRYRSAGKIPANQYRALLRDSSFQVRWFTMARIGDLGNEKTELLRELRAGGIDDRIIAFCLRLDPLAAGKMMPFLRQAIVHSDPQIRIWAFEILARLARESDQLQAALIEYASRENETTVQSVCRQLGLIGPDD